VEASNSCAGTLIFGSFLSSVKVFFPSIFVFWLSVLLSFLLLSNWFFYRPSFSSFFNIVLFLFFLSHVVSSLAYLNLLVTKRLDCCCCGCCCIYFLDCASISATK
jgi:hypothetical protein